MVTEAGLSSTSLGESDSCKDTLARGPALANGLNEPGATSPSSRKRKIDHKAAIECYPMAAKRRFESQMLMGDPKLAEGKFLCWCSEWISISLENWRKHILNCQHSKAKGVLRSPSSLEDIFGIAMESSPKTTDNERRDRSIISTHPSGIHGEEDLDLRKAGKEVTSVQYGNYTADIGSNATNHGDLENDLESETATPYPIRRKKPNRTEEERLREFLDDPQVKEVMPYQVLCRACNKWIKLRNNSRYCSVPWRCHKATCKWNATSRENANATSSAGMSSSKVEIMHSSSARRLNIKTSPANAHPSVQTDLTVQSPPCNSEPPPKARRLHAESRKAILEADPNAELVEPHRVLCGLCKKWVKLRPKSTFCSAPWQSHVRRCIAKCAKKNLKVSSTSNLKEGKLSSRLVAGASSAASPGIDNDMTPKHRGRPRKNPAPETTVKDVKESMESDRSYESEEL